MTRRMLIVAVLAVGCGGGGSTGVEDTPGPRARLVEIGQLIRLHQQDQNRPPAKLSDVQKYATGFPLGVQAVARGEVVLVWGAGVTPGKNGDKILAHGKDAATQGGWVLTQDGDVKAMTGQQFQSSAKAVP